MEGKKKTLSLEKADAKFPFLALVWGHLNGNHKGTPAGADAPFPLSETGAPCPQC